MILFTSDLLFGSKILGAAKHAGLRGQGVRNRGALTQHATAPGACRVTIDAETHYPDAQHISRNCIHGNEAELTLAPDADTNELLAALIQRAEVTRYEVREPSLHEIFKRIAGTEPR